MCPRHFFDSQFRLFCIGKSSQYVKVRRTFQNWNCLIEFSRIITSCRQVWQKGISIYLLLILANNPLTDMAHNLTNKLYEYYLPPYQILRIKEEEINGYPRTNQPILPSWLSELALLVQFIILCHVISCGTTNHSAHLAIIC